MRLLFFFFNEAATTEIYTSSHTLSLHDALPICVEKSGHYWGHHSSVPLHAMRSEEHTSELQSRELISYAVFCLKKKKREERKCNRSNKPKNKYRNKR